MPTASFRNALAGAAVIENVFTGSQYEILTNPAEIIVALTQDGGAIGDIVATMLSGSDTLGEEQPISNANRMPILPDDAQFTDIAAAMDRLKLKLRNTTAATARVVFTTLRINFL